MGDMLKELERLLHPKGQLTELGFCALIGEDTISIDEGFCQNRHLERDETPSRI